MCYIDSLVIVLMVIVIVAMIIVIVVYVKARLMLLIHKQTYFAYLKRLCFATQIGTRQAGPTLGNNLSQH